MTPYFKREKKSLKYFFSTASIFPPKQEVFHQDLQSIFTGAEICTSRFSIFGTCCKIYEVGSHFILEMTAKGKAWVETFFFFPEVSWDTSMCVGETIYTIKLLCNCTESGRILWHFFFLNSAIGSLFW